MTVDFRSRAATAVLVGGLSSTACIITTTEDDTTVGETSGDPSTTSPTGSDATTPTATDPTLPSTSGPSDDTGLPPPAGECTDNLFADPGFEGGTPNASWDEASELFGTPICDASCTDMPGAGPHGGAFWAWFGGLENAADFATVAQAVTIPEGDAAVLTFWLQIRSGSGTGNDLFAITIDDAQVFFAADTDMAVYDGYTQVEVDVTDFADGQTHMVYFDADIAGVGLTSYFLDDVSLVSCVDEAPGTTTGVTSGLDSSSGDGNTSSTDSGGATDTGSATDSGGATSDSGATSSGGTSDGASSGGESGSAGSASAG